MGASYHLEYDHALAIPEIKLIQHEHVCKIHRLRTRLTYDYDADGTNVYISKCCCLDFAKEMAATLYNSGLVSKVYLEAKTGLTTSGLFIKSASHTTG